jgi:phospholipid-transporting ATPase
VDEYAQEGLRTLFLAEKFIDEETYSSWLKESNAAKLEINNREEKVAAVDEKIEIELELIGSTAIEDRLQDEVADTIQFMKKTGIKVWVLTGDKIETAINIGVSAGLLDSNMAQHLVDEENIPDLYKSLTLVNKKIRESEKGIRQAIIVAGHSLVSIDSDDNVRELFLKASDQVDVVLACRVSPKQKADIVGMIRERFPQKITLSIGDGANDVSMILKAHVGVGILGKEGQQAARSADFAIG